MEVVLKRAKSGDMLVLVRFKEDTNFDVEKLEWCPRIDELDILVEAKNKIMVKNENKLKRS